MKFSSVTHALFQANMWRDYAMSWDGKGRRHSKDWVEKILQVSRADCIRRARVALQAAKEMNEAAKRQAYQQLPSSVSCNVARQAV